jgi:hypothetical protein
MSENTPTDCGNSGSLRIGCGCDTCEAIRKKLTSVIEEREEREAIEQLCAAYNKLVKLGWDNPIYCPKDGTPFHIIEPPSTGIHECIYAGEWPYGEWIAVWAGDSSISYPLLYKKQKSEKE